MADFVLDLRQGGDRHRDPIGFERLKQQPLDLCVDRQGAHFLADRRGQLIVISRASIDRIVGVRAGISQSHAPPTPAANHETLQKSGALARDAALARLIAAKIVAQPLLIGHELFPTDVAGEGVSKTDRPILDWNRHGRSMPDP